jgi:hypothetical protein
MRPFIPAAWALLAVLGSGCQTRSRSSEPAPSAAPSAAGLASLLQPDAERPIPSAVIEAAKQLQARKLTLSPERTREPRLAFGQGVLGQLTDTELRVFDSRDFQLLKSEPLEGPRVLVALADGSLLAVGLRQALRFDPSNKKLSRLARPVLLPGAELYADAVLPDRIWVFDGASRSSADAARPRLSSMQLGPSPTGILLADRQAELELPPGGVLGTTREGVWLYLSQRSAERFGPGGARLSKLSLPELSDLLWMLPARRLDQCYLVDQSGRLSRAVVSPSFKQLPGIQLSGTPWGAAAGDEGRLLAAVVVTGQGPRFELQLFDAELEATGRTELPAEAPTGSEDWVKVVTRNPGLAVAAREPRVAVGGPDRVLLFDARGKQIFSIPSR